MVQHPVPTHPSSAAFPLVTREGAVPIYYDPGDAPVVGVALDMLAADLEIVTGQRPRISTALPDEAESVVIVGTLGASALLGRLPLPEETRQLAGSWERFHITVLENPLPGIARALVVAGSDRRGTAYGILEISRQLGVSPWCWWADVPYPGREEVQVLPMEAPSPGPPSATAASS